MNPSWLTAPSCVPVVPKGSGFAFPVSCDRKNAASAEFSTCDFPTRPSDYRLPPFQPSQQPGSMNARYLFRFRIRKRIFASEIKIVAQPFPILRVAGYGDRPRLKGGLIVSQNIIWDQLHRMMKLPTASCGVSCEILRSHYPPSPRLRRVPLAFIPVAAYSAEVVTSATKAGSYGVFGEGE